MNLLGKICSANLSKAHKNHVNCKNHVEAVGPGNFLILERLEIAAKSFDSLGNTRTGRVFGAAATCLDSQT